jgi:hypothetical protein
MTTQWCDMQRLRHKAEYQFQCIHKEITLLTSFLLNGCRYLIIIVQSLLAVSFGKTVLSCFFIKIINRYKNKLFFDTFVQYVMLSKVQQLFCVASVAGSIVM